MMISKRLLGNIFLKWMIYAMRSNNSYKITLLKYITCIFMRKKTLYCNETTLSANKYPDSVDFL